MNRPTIPCSNCNGKGSVTLSEELTRSLAVVKKMGQATAHDIHKRCKEKVDVTAVNNRMRKLLALGLVKKISIGKPFIFVIK